MPFLSSPLDPFRLALTLGCFVSVLIALEISFAPWSPYFWATATATLVIPLLFADLSPVMTWGLSFVEWPYLLFAATILFTWEVGLCSWLYESWYLLRRHPSKRASHSVDVNLDLARTIAGRKSPRFEVIAFTLLTFVWAPLSENLFYWGFLYRNLRLNLGFMEAALITNFLYGLRHFCHFFPLKPKPWPAMAAYFISVAGAGFVNCLIFEKVNSLLPLMFFHFIANILLTWQYLRRQNDFGLMPHKADAD